MERYLVENKENNNWEHKEFVYYDPEDLDIMESYKNFGEKFYNDGLEKLNFKDAKWFFAEDDGNVELKMDDYTIYIGENYNDHYSAYEMDVYISIVPKQGKYPLSEIINLPSDLVKYGQKLATKLGSKDTEPSLISLVEVHC